jgi:hypothetical protein
MVVIGLKKRDTFEEVVEYIKHPKDVIKFPDRFAKQIRNSFELSQLDGIGMMEHEEHELQTMKETEKANALRKVARNSNDTSHVELLAHSRQSAISPPQPKVFNTSTTTQTDAVYHKIHTDDEATEQVGKLKSQYQEQADKLREEAEVEHKVLENRHKQKISNLVNEHSNDMTDLANYHESKHHTAQAILQREMNMKSQSHQQMYDHQARLQEQRHQAEMAKQKKKFESQLRDERRPVVEEPKEKRLIVTRSMAEAVQQNYTDGVGQSSTDVPMATAPPNPYLTDRMSDDSNRQKRNTSEESEATKKQKTARGDEAVPSNPQEAEAKPSNKPNTKVNPKDAESKSSNKVINTKLKPDNRNPDNVTTQKIEGKSKSWWLRQNIATVKAQAELRGIRFTDAQTKGEKGSYGNSPIPKFKKQDYLNELYKLLGV